MRRGHLSRGIQLVFEYCDWLAEVGSAGSQHSQDGISQEPCFGQQQPVETAAVVGSPFSGQYSQRDVGQQQPAVPAAAGNLCEKPWAWARACIEQQNEVLRT